MRRQVNLVDHQQVASGDSWAAFAGDFVSFGHIDDINGPVGQLGRKSGGQIVAPGFDNDCFQSRKFSFQLRDGGQVDTGILTNSAVRTAACLDSNNPLQGENLPAGQKLRILARVDVVG